MGHLELQTRPQIDTLCSDSSLDFAPANYTSSIEKYMYPESVFSEHSGIEDQSDREHQDIFDEAWLLGKKIGAYDAEESFWNMAIKPASAPMDVIYNYRSIMYSSIVLPKRLQVIEGGVEKKENYLIEKGYTVLIQDEFETLTSVPSWKDFFHIPNKQFIEKNVRAFETTRLNIKSWQAGLNQGYFEGVCLALFDYKQAMENLGSDFSERYLYVIAERRGLTKKPKIQAVKIPYEVNGSSLDLDSNIYKVEDEGEFNNKSEWGGI